MGYFDKDKACQAYVIALGVNDLLTFRMEPGSISDIDPEDYRNNKPTYLGYLAQVISKYKEISPDAKFFLVTFPDCETPGRKEEATLDNVKVMSELAEYFDNTYLLNMYEYGPKFNAEFQQKYYLHGHLNPMGYLLQAKLVDSYIDYIIRHNPDDFRNAGFIGTDIDYK